MNQTTRNILTWVAIGALLIFFYNSFMQGNQAGFGQQPVSLSYTEFMNNAQSGMVENILLKGQNVTGKMSDGTAFKTFTTK